jgi:pyruvate kinase
LKHDGPTSVVDIDSELLSWRPDDPLARKAKVVGTLGPATMTLEMIEKLIKAGLDIFRLNSSHRQGGDFERIVPIIREAAKRLGRDVYILGDLQGPKFRCGTVQGESVELVVGETVEMALMESESDLTVPGRITLADTVEQNAMIRGLEVGMDVLLNDGFLAMKVVERVSPNAVKCEITIGGPLKSRKGINVPDLQIDCAALTAKDRDDAEYLLDKVDYMAVSFVQKGADIQELIDIMDAKGIAAGDRPLIIPKIEKPAALKNIDEILAVSDGLMVARGDMGVELGLERVPFAQKFLIKKANEANKFCICATQMMESMIEAPVPTRAEVSDVANAIFDGSDAVMLSGECAVGKFPCETVEAMGRTISAAERHVKLLSPGF